MNKPICYPLVLMLLLFLGVAAAAVADEPDRLEEIRKRIEQTSDSLAEQKNAEKNLLKDLSIVTTRIEQIDRRIDELKKNKKVLSQQLAAARSRQEETRQQLGALEKQVNRRLVSLYKEGELGPLKLFFSATSPTELVRHFQYLSRVLQGDRELLAEFGAVLASQQESQRHYLDLQKKQEQLLANEQQSRAEIARGRTLHKQILSQVKKDKKRLAQELDELVAREKRLKSLVKQLEEDREPPAPATGKSFARLKGSLPWPIDGSVSVGFGTQKNAELGAVLESHGIEIAYSSPQPVRSVAAGRIVFASWFKGYGNLMIVAHDAGYHTLYAQLDSMSAGIGDMVGEGTTIAQTGPVDGQGLYFEIRHNGAPINPALWLRTNRNR
ncbi:MAG: peptidoglycan DD-metalloendopeptidase family protein [Desulfuromonadales bacterium]|nr:peptidoglycan DD-metalloendopeptidase family protein [Desulfuromonadales bacterium]